MCLESTASAKLVRHINDAVNLIWRLTEVHIAKIVFIVVAVFIAQNVSFFIYPFVYSFKFSAVFLTCREVLCFYLFYKFIVIMSF